MSFICRSVFKVNCYHFRNFSINSLNFCKMSISTTNCIVAVCQFTANNDKLHNLKTVQRLVDRATKQEAKIVFLPEACDFIGNNKDEIRQLAEPLTGPLITEYRQLAKNQKVWLSIGGFHQLIESNNEQPKIANSHIIIDDCGEIRSIYQKIHLFDVTIPARNINLKESELVYSGTEIVPPVATPAGALGLSICYDLRFPEMAVIQRKLGAQILTYPSAFTSVTGEAHWEILLRARAIENQCYVIAAAQYGRHNNKRISYGQSLIVDPWGRILAECPKYKPEQDTDESIAVASIDLERIKSIADEMPVFQHRRNDLYQLKSINLKSLPINDNENFMFNDKIIPGATVFYRTQYSFAFTNIRCVVPGHVLISTQRLARRLEDLTNDEISDLFQTAVRVQKVMEIVHKAESSTLCVQDGKDAGQTVPHVHVHILPRKLGDFEHNDEIYEKLARHDRDDNPDAIRNLSEQITEATMLRQYFL